MLTSRAALLSSGLDPDVAAYASAIVANGGSASQTWLRNVNTFVRGCKADGIWDSLLDVGLLCGADNLPGALVKLKTPSGVSRTLTNNNFVSGDYTASGATAGLLGNGTNKWLGVGISRRPLGNTALSAYLTAPPAAGSSRFWVAAGTALTDVSGLGRTATGNNDTFSDGINTWWATVAAAPRVGFFVGSATSATSRTISRNGVELISNNTLDSTADTTSTYSVFGRSAGADITSAKISFYHIGAGLSPSQVAALSNRVNALMATIGANQY